MRFEPLLEKDLLPDSIIRWGARRITGARLRQITSYDIEEHQKYLMEYIQDLNPSIFTFTPSFTPSFCSLIFIFIYLAKISPS